MKTIVEWADFQISQGCEEEGLIDLSLSGGKKESEIITVLHKMAGNKPFTLFSHDFFLGYYRKQLLKEPSRWFEIEEKILNYLFLDYDSLDEELILRVSILEEDFSLRKDNLPGSLQMPKDLMDFLKDYSNFQQIYQQLMDVGLYLESWQ